MSLKPEHLETLIQYLKPLLQGNRIAYASVPITTGKRYLDWRKTTPDPFDRTARQTYVIQPNIESARAAIRELRERRGCTVIDPTQLEEIKLDWTQEDYYRFWDTIIQTLVTEIVFLDGWEYSTGCAHELVSAVHSGMPTFSQDGEPLPVERAVRMLQRSLQEYHEQGLDNPGLEKILNTLVLPCAEDSE